MLDESLLQMSAVELARRIRCRSVSSREVVAAHIARCRHVNPSINAIVAERYEAAQREAEAADRAVAERRELGPLHGVPFTVKESIALTGMPRCAGLVARAEYRSDVDATVVARVRAAGAIPLGVSNTSELCMWMESSNRVYGRTNNPYDTSRTVGGSSGGEGAIVASGASPFGVGSDIGGSIRMPAFFNGVFGHKPTGGLVPNSGQFPASEKNRHAFLTTGPICRRAEDLLPLLHVMAGPDGLDAACKSIAWSQSEPLDIRRLRVLHVPDNGSMGVCDELRVAQDEVASHLSRRGARVERRRFLRLRRSLEIWSAMLAEATDESFRSALGDGIPLHLWRQIALFLMGRSPHTLPALGLACFESVLKASGKSVLRYVEEGRALRAELAAELGDDGIMLYPVYPQPAPRHRSALIPPTRWAYAAILNVLEMPATSVPLGLGRRGLPLGIQVAAGVGWDCLTIGVAMELERAFGGWQLPTGPSPLRSPSCEARDEPLLQQS